MSTQTDNLLTLVKPYGLSAEESRIYLHLLKQGVLTALELSRQLHMGRTKVYRILDDLKQKQLVEYQVHTRGLKFGAAHPKKLKQIVTQKQGEVETLKQGLPDLVRQLTSLIPQDQDGGKVLYYEGVRGLEQVSYNITKAKDQLRVFEMEHMSDFLDENLAEDIRRQLVKQQVLTRDLTNKKTFEGFTQVKEMISSYSQFRYIDPQQLEIKFETLIYNDVYATYTYQDDQIFCVEIYNSQLAEMQKQLFDFIWQQAQPMRFVSSQGAAELDPRKATSITNDSNNNDNNNSLAFDNKNAVSTVKDLKQSGSSQKKAFDQVASNASVSVQTPSVQTPSMAISSPSPKSMGRNNEKMRCAFLQLSKPQIDDLPAIRQILLAWNTQSETAKYAKRVKQEIDGQPEFNQRFWVLKNKSKVVGLGGLADCQPKLQPFVTVDEPSCLAELKAVYLSPECRGQGWGRFLVIGLETKAAQQGCKQLLLVSADKYKDTAYGFYRHLGYNRVGTVEGGSENKKMAVFSKVLDTK